MTRDDDENDEFHEDGTYLGTMPTKAEADRYEDINFFEAMGAVGLPVVVIGFNDPSDMTKQIHEMCAEANNEKRYLYCLSCPYFTTDQECLDEHLAAQHPTEPEQIDEEQEFFDAFETGTDIYENRGAEGQLTVLCQCEDYPCCGH